MNRSLTGWNVLDRWAISLSAICLAHCLGSAILLALLSSVGRTFLNPAIHEIGFALAIVLGAIALGRGVLTHGFAMPAWIGALGLGVMAGAMTLRHSETHEIVYTVLGVALLALGHDLNRRAAS